MADAGKFSPSVPDGARGLERQQKQSVVTDGDAKGPDDDGGEDHPSGRDADNGDATTDDAMLAALLQQQEEEELRAHGGGRHVHPSGRGGGASTSSHGGVTAGAGGGGGGTRRPGSTTGEPRRGGLPVPRPTRAQLLRQEASQPIGARLAKERERRESEQDSKSSSTSGEHPHAENVLSGTLIYTATCPHCEGVVIVRRNMIKCGVMRHAVMKKTGVQVGPHTGKYICEMLVKEKKIYGCGKPFRVLPPSRSTTASPTSKDEMPVLETQKCAYV